MNQVGQVVGFPDAGGPLDCGACGGAAAADCHQVFGVERAIDAPARVAIYGGVGWRAGVLYVAEDGGDAFVWV